MIDQLKPKSEFTKNVLTLMTGTTIAQAIPIAISPILTRIYSPEDFGLFAIFFAVSTIFASLVNGRYELAIMLPKKDEDAINIVALGLIINFMVTFIIVLIIVFFNTSLSNLLGNIQISMWLYFIPISVFFIGLFNLLNYFNSRKKNYKDISNAIISKSITLSIVQIIIGLVKNGVAGLISGYILSNIVSNFKLFSNLYSNKLLISKINKLKILALSKKYKNFPKFSMPAIFANTLSLHLTNILIGTFYNISTLGFYSLIQKVLGMPSSLIGSSISQVFFQEATKEKQLTGKAILTFNNTLKKLIVIAIPSFGILYFSIKDIFGFIFGKEWSIAGEYAIILIPLFCIRFISSALSISTSIFEKQAQNLQINIILIITSIGIISISYLYSFEFKYFLKLYSFCMSLAYFVFIFYYNKIVR